MSGLYMCHNVIEANAIAIVPCQYYDLYIDT